MPSTERDSSRDGRERELVLKHQHSFSENGRASVPMWDSADPDRAPPPLPLNPGTCSSPTTRPNTSARIEEAAALIASKARENAPSSYTTNVMPNGSPEKSLVKPHHRRMQSVQSGNVRGLSDSLERRSPDKGLRVSRLADYENRSPERAPVRPESATPTHSERTTPILSNKQTTDENTPPSAAMLALQSMRARAESEAPLANITNSSNNIGRPPYTFDAISSQILGLTSIATNLQREMTALSRRSKDNATDLVSLKEATNCRDEDIRTSLKELILNVESSILNAPASSNISSRSAPLPGLYLDSKPHNTTPSKKSFSLPRIPSPNSFSAAAIERELTASPSIVSYDGAASIALLDKVLREMGTKEGQEKILKILETVKNSSKESPVDPSLMTKLDDILRLLKDNSSSVALIRAHQDTKTMSNIRGESSSGQLTRTTKEVHFAPDPRVPEVVSDEVMNTLKRVKQSVSEGGGLTNEVKALVRELRGEVLGMGREIARKLEQVQASRDVMEDMPKGPDREEIANIVDEGLHDLKQHMAELVREHRRQSAESSRNVVDTQEVVHAVRNALADLPRPKEEPVRDLASEREDMLAAVREAWEDCKPEIALEHFGLEREEILDTLKEGLRAYEPRHPEVKEVGASYDEVLSAIQKGLADFRPPPIETPETLTREEVLMSVRECLESFDFPTPAPAESIVREADLTRDDVADAVREGLNSQSHITKEIEFNRDDLFDAVKAGLDGLDTPMRGVGEQVLDQVHELLASMKTEFKQYSAANGKDTEQVLDAMKDGFEELRGDIECYVDRAADVTGKDEILDTVKDCFRSMQADIEKVTSHQPRELNTPELLDAMEKEFEHLRDTMNKSLNRSEPSTDREEILDAIRDINDERSSTLSSNSEDVVRLVKEELEHMRTTLAGTLVRPPTNIDREEILDTIREGLDSSRTVKKTDGNESILSNTSELLDAFQDGVDNIRSDMEKLMNRPVDISTSYEILDTLKTGLEGVRSDIDKLHTAQRDLSDTATARGREVMVHDENMISTEIEGLKVMITQLRIKVEAMDGPPIVAEPSHDFEEVNSMLREVHAAVNTFNSDRGTSTSDNAATKEDTDAIETLLRNIRAKLDDVSIPDIDVLARSSQVDIVEDLIREIKLAVDEADISRTGSIKEDLGSVEVLLKQVVAHVEDVQDKVKAFTSDDDRVTKTDIQVVETLCLDTKTQLDVLDSVDFASLPTRDDFQTVHDTIRSFQDRVESENELTAQAFEARKTEHGGIATKIDDVREILSEIRAELISKLDGSEEGIVELSKVLGHHHESMSAYASAASIEELTDMVKLEFEKHHDNHKKNRSEIEEHESVFRTKYEESHANATSELTAKIEEKFNEMMTKYDDAQISNESKLEGFEQRDSENLEAMTNTKAVVEDLKLLIDTLGSTTSEACDRMTDDSKTVFNRVAEANMKLDELSEMSSNQHNITRDEVARAFAATTRVEASVFEHHPAILAAIKEVATIVAQHYEHSQTHYQHSQSTAEEIRSNINAIPSAIPPLLPGLPAPAPLTREIPVGMEYDDSQVHDKLNVLVNHANTAKEALLKMETRAADTKEPSADIAKLDELHGQMLTTAGEVSAMITTQTRLMTEHHDSRATEAAEAAIALEKRVAQKEKVEIDIMTLNTEKSELLASVEEMKREREEMNVQTRKLTREVSKLETALNLRQEEMRDMESRAENLERRILEGVMDHARSMNMLKPVAGKKNKAADRDRAMSLKRVPSTASTSTTKTISTKDQGHGGSNLGNAVSMALKKRAPLRSAANSAISSRASGVERRILSTSNMTGNRSPHPPAADRQLVLAPMSSQGNTGLINLKRSHSVKSNPSTLYGGRKSWTSAAITDLSSQSGAADKENSILTEEDEEGERSAGEDGSEAATERRTSFSGTVSSGMYTDSLAYGTGSSMSYGTSTTGARSASYASSAAGLIGGLDGSIEEETTEDDSVERSMNPTDPHDASSSPIDNDNENANSQLIILSQAQEDESSKIMALLDQPGTITEISITATTQPPPQPQPPHSHVSSQPSSPSSPTFSHSDLQPPRPFVSGKGEDIVLYSDKHDGYNGQHGSDSGLGSEPQTADLEKLPRGGGRGYF